MGSGNDIPGITCLAGHYFGEAAMVLSGARWELRCVLRRWLVGGLCVIAFGPWLLPIAVFGAELSDSEVWCVQAGNRNMVIATAAQEGLGEVQGKGGIYLPAGSNDEQGLNIGQWRQRRPKEFGRICDKTYRAVTGNPTEESQDTDENDQLS